MTFTKSELGGLTINACQIVKEIPVTFHCQKQMPQRSEIAISC